MSYHVLVKCDIETLVARVVLRNRDHHRHQSLSPSSSVSLLPSSSPPSSLSFLPSSSSPSSLSFLPSSSPSLLIVTQSDNGLPVRACQFGPSDYPVSSRDRGPSKGLSTRSSGVPIASKWCRDPRHPHGSWVDLSRILQEAGITTGPNPILQVEYSRVGLFWPCLEIIRPSLLVR